MNMRVVHSVTKKASHQQWKREDWISFPENVEPRVILAYALLCLDDIQLSVTELLAVSGEREVSFWQTYLSVHTNKLHSCMIRFLGPLDEEDVGQTRPLREWALGQRESLLELKQRYTSFRLYVKLVTQAQSPTKQQAYLSVLQKEICLLRQLLLALHISC